MNRDGNDPLRPKSNDPGWNHNVWAYKGNRVAVRCNYCGFVSNGGISRAKQHQIGGNRNVNNCQKVPDEARAELIEYVERQKAKKNTDDLHELTMDFEAGGYGDDEPDEDGDVEIVSTQNKRTRVEKPTRPNVKGPLDHFVTKGFDSNEWLTGIMDDDRVHSDEDLTWTTVGEASGAGEPTRRTRSHSSPSRPSSSRYVCLSDEEDDIY
ncbi:hypothetical protein CTI12_AA329680 [Artemisia annua]|uniref:BED-type domain-containing protein n=1 Tax=Artemisia annua TaxID=35608 RepID=A0A2U1MXZ2_ARTAN|nr:hypothetical protein CTI12_AA329680 [Artemisia annua]